MALQLRMVRTISVLDHPNLTAHGSESQCCSSKASKLVDGNLFWLFVWPVPETPREPELTLFQHTFCVCDEHPKCAETQNPPEQRAGVKKRSHMAVSTPYFKRFGFSFQLVGSQGSNSNGVQLTKVMLSDSYYLGLRVVRANRGWPKNKKPCFPMPEQRAIQALFLAGLAYL